MERRIKRVEELGPFEEWGLSEECLSFLKKVKADPEKVLVIVRLGSIEFGDDLFFEHPSYQWCDDDLLYKEYPSIEFRKELDVFYCEIIKSLERFLLEHAYLRFVQWMANFIAHTDYYFVSSTRSWHDTLFYKDGTFKHQGYEGINTDVEKKIVRLLQEYWNSLSPEQYCLFSSLLINWETIDEVLDANGLSLWFGYKTPREGCERVLSEIEDKIDTDFVSHHKPDFFERIAEIILM